MALQIAPDRPSWLDEILRSSRAEASYKRLHPFEIQKQRQELEMMPLRQKLLQAQVKSAAGVAQQLPYQLEILKQQALGAPLQRGLLGAHTKLYQAQAYAARHPELKAAAEDNILKKMNLMQSIAKTEGPNSLKVGLLGQQVRRLAAGNRGLSVQTTPEGGVNVSMGGSAAPMGMGGSGGMGGSQRVPGTGTARGTAASYVDPMTGQVKTMPTQPALGMQQRSLSSMRQLQIPEGKIEYEDLKGPLKRLVEGITPSLGLGGALKTWYDKSKAYAGLLGKSDTAKETKKRLIRLRDATNVSTTQLENVLKAQGITPGIGTIQEFRKVLTPAWDETKDQFIGRTVAFVNDLVDKQKITREMVTGLKAGKFEEPEFIKKEMKRETIYDAIVPRYEMVKNPRYKAPEEVKEEPKEEIIGAFAGADVPTGQTKEMTIDLDGVKTKVEMPSREDIAFTLTTPEGKNKTNEELIKDLIRKGHIKVLGSPKNKSIKNKKPRKKRSLREKLYNPYNITGRPKKIMETIFRSL